MTNITECRESLNNILKYVYDHLGLKEDSKEIPELGTSQSKSILEAITQSYISAVDNFLISNSSDISSVYDKLKRNLLPYNTVEAIPIENIVDKYSEYFSGMVEYVAKSVVDVNYNGLTDKESYEELFKRFISKDKSNTDAIFSGDYEDSMELISIGDAMKNVEYLANIEADCKNFVAILGKIIANTNPDCNMYAARAAFGLYIASVSYYLFKTIDYIIGNFESIESSMEERVPSPYTKQRTEFKIV